MLSSIVLSLVVDRRCLLVGLIPAGCFLGRYVDRALLQRGRPVGLLPPPRHCQMTWRERSGGMPVAGAGYGP
jgi:hypothetical protein